MDRRGAEKGADICLKHQVMLVSDEIHGDIVYDGHVHHSFLVLDERYAQNFIHLSAPSKSFNVAGLKANLETALECIPWVLYK